MENEDLVSVAMYAHHNRDEEVQALKDRIKQLENDRTILFNVLLDIRQKTGVGQKPMLFELADVLAEKCNQTGETK